MPTPNDSSVRRRPDGSIDIEHYAAVAHGARTDEARVLRSAVRSALRDILLGRRQELAGEFQNHSLNDR